jgi:hypothetical protein
MNSLFNDDNNKGKVKFHCAQARGKASRILGLGTRWTSVASFMLQPL